MTGVIPFPARGPSFGDAQRHAVKDHILRALEHMKASRATGLNSIVAMAALADALDILDEREVVA